MDDHDEGPGLFFSRTFWLCGLASVLMWTAVVYVVVSE